MLKKIFAAFLSFSLAAFTALTPAAAQSFEAPGSSPVRPLSAAALPLSPAAMLPPGAELLALPSSLQAPETPAAAIPTAVDAAAELAQPHASAEALPDAVGPAEASSPRRETARHDQTGAPAAERPLQAAASAEKTPRPDGQRWNSLFDNSRSAAENAGPVEGRLAPESAALQPASAGQDGSGRGVPPAPRASLLRSLRVGLVGAVGMLLSVGIPSTIAQMAGYHFHSNYHAISMGHPTLMAATALLVIGSVMAPIAEEMIFRVGVHGVLRRLPLLRMPWVTAAISALIFTAVHETSDPVLFFGRFLGAMILARVYQKEGVTASMSAHGIYNGLLFGASFLTIAFGGLGSVMAAALIPAALVSSVVAWHKLKEQRAQRAAGLLVPLKVKPLTAVLFSALLLAGMSALIPTPVWAVGGTGWAIYALRAARRALREGKMTQAQARLATILAAAMMAFFVLAVPALLPALLVFWGAAHGYRFLKRTFGSRA